MDIPKYGLCQRDLHVTLEIGNNVAVAPTNVSYEAPSVSSISPAALTRSAPNTGGQSKFLLKHILVLHRYLTPGKI